MKDYQELLNNIKKDFLAMLAQYMPADSVLSVILYGSYARGDFNNDSDIDIFVLYDSTKITPIEVSTVLGNISYILDIAYHVYTIPVAETLTFYEQNKHTEYFQNIQKEGIVWKKRKKN